MSALDAGRTDSEAGVGTVAASGSALAREIVQRSVAELEASLSDVEWQGLSEVLDQTVRSLQALAEASPRDPDYVDRFEHACERLDELAKQVAEQSGLQAPKIAARLSRAAQSLRERRQAALDQMVASQGESRRKPSTRTDSAPLSPYRVSGRAPRLHDLPNLSFDALQRCSGRRAAQLHSSPSGGAADAESGAQLRSLARECLASIGRMSVLCRLDGDRIWSSVVAGFERRLLDNLDAFVALGRPDLDARDLAPASLEVPSDSSPDPVPVADVEPRHVPEPVDWSLVVLDPPPTVSAQAREDGLELPLAVGAVEPAGGDLAGEAGPFGRAQSSEDVDDDPPTLDLSPPQSEPPASESAASDDPFAALLAGPELLALPSAVDLIEILGSYTSEAPGDPVRAFVHSFVLGSLAGEETVRAAMLQLRRAPAGTLGAHARALALAPNPAIRAALEALCNDPDPRLISLGLDVLRCRANVPFAEVATLIDHPDGGVRRSAARSLAIAEHRLAARELLASQAASELDEGTLAVVAEALLRLDDRRGLVIVRGRLADEAEFPGSLPRRARLALLRLLALSGDGSDLETLLALAERPAEIEILGWFGHAGAVDFLLGVLAEHSSPALYSTAETRPLAAARALQRLTAGMDPRSSPRGVGYRPDATTPDPARWTAWWQEHRDRFEPGTKHRHGQPFTVEASFAELGSDGVAQDVRECAALELSILSGGIPGPWLGGWSSWLEAGLADWREHFRRYSQPTGAPLHGAGEWPARRLGERHRTIAASHEAG